MWLFYDGIVLGVVAVFIAVAVGVSDVVIAVCAVVDVDDAVVICIYNVVVVYDMIVIIVVVFIVASVYDVDGVVLVIVLDQAKGRIQVELGNIIYEIDDDIFNSIFSEFLSSSKIFFIIYIYISTLIGGTIYRP